MKKVLLIGIIPALLLVAWVYTATYANESVDVNQITDDTKIDSIQSEETTKIFTRSIKDMSTEELSNLFVNATPESMIEVISSFDPLKKVVLMDDGSYLQGGVDMNDSETASTYESVDAETDVNGISVKEFENLIIAHWDELEQLSTFYKNK